MSTPHTGTGAAPVARLHATHAEEVTALLCEAFFDYPVMRYVLGDTPDYACRLVRLIAVATGLVAQALVGLPFWTALFSGVVPGTRKLGEAAAGLVAGLVVAHAVDWFRRGVLYWRGAAMVASRRRIRLAGWPKYDAMSFVFCSAASGSKSREATYR